MSSTHVLPKNFLLKISFAILASLVAPQIHSALLTQASAETDEDPLQSGEEDFQNGNNTEKGNEDSDTIVGVQLGQPSYGGSGCPQGTMSATLSPDSKTLSVIFDQFMSRADATTAKRVMNDCNMRIPVSVPAGYKVQATRIDYRGYAAAPKSGRGVLKVQYQMYDSSGSALGKEIKRRKIFPGPRDDMYLVSSRVKVGPASGCGKNFTLGITGRAIAVTNKKGEDAIMTVDTVDSSETVRYFLRWKKCKP
jgi:hypothetical protein